MRGNNAESSTETPRPGDKCARSRTVTTGSLDVSICQDAQTADINRLAEFRILRAYSIEQSAPRHSSLSVSHGIRFARRLKMSSLATVINSIRHRVAYLRF